MSPAPSAQSPQGHQPAADLDEALEGCRRYFPQVFATLSHAEPEVTPFDVLDSAWRVYYFGAFSRFDRLLQAQAGRLGARIGHYLPVSISHHNLHRLMEVLQAEIGQQPLNASRVPERVEDLLEVTRRLGELLEQAGRFAKPGVDERQAIGGRN